MGKILLSEWARRNNIEPATARQKALRGNLQTAEKSGSIWLIDENEPNIDNRIKTGKYIKKEQKDIPAKID